MACGIEQDRDWEAENDARILADAKVIQADQKRLDKAAKASLRMAKEKSDEAEAMKRVGRQKNNSPQLTKGIL